MDDPRQEMFRLSLKHHRERRGWTQEQLAILLHYEDQASISLLETGKRGPSFLQAVEIAQIFETTVNEMCGYRLPERGLPLPGGAVLMNHGFVLFGSLECRKLRDMMTTFLDHMQQTDLEERPAPPPPRESAPDAC